MVLQKLRMGRLREGLDRIHRKTIRSCLHDVWIAMIRGRNTRQYDDGAGSLS